MGPTSKGTKISKKDSSVHLQMDHEIAEAAVGGPLITRKKLKRARPAKNKAPY
jgi:hypothetical protein